MLYSDKDIRRFLAEGKIVIQPSPDLDVQLGPCSIDLRLGNNFLVFDHSRIPYIDVHDEKLPHDYMHEVIVPDDQPFIMQPREFVLAATVESVTLADDIVARLEGRSSLGRLGIVVHATAGKFDPGWIGNVVMELGNHGVMPVALYPGMRICALTFEQVSSPVEVPYRLRPSSKYIGQTKPEASKIMQDKDTFRRSS
jgi:dCTP deaminase